MKFYAFMILIVSIALVLFGSMLVLSASSTFSDMKFDNPQHLFWGHIGKAIGGIVIMLILMLVDYHWYKKYSKWVLIGGIGLLIMTFMFAPSIKGSLRSISIAGISFQPVELVKLALFIHLAAMLEKVGDDITDLKKGVINPMIWIMTVAGLVFLQPNVSNGVLILAIGITVLFVAGIQIKHFLSFAASAATLALAYALIRPHSLKRIASHVGVVFGNGDFHPQVLQSLYGLGSGGFFGVGLGNSAQRNLFLPEAYGDFIFAIVGEEAGLLGTVLVLLGYGTILVFGILIAKNAKDKFGKLLAFSVSFSIALYAFVNAAVAIGVFPVTGLPLPLISHGGTAIIIVCASLGILLNIGWTAIPKEAKVKEPKEAKTWQEQTV
ncbi:MAG: FtsW/RodA/SpoVE family cell cycle protein [Ignavibacteria bacterium]|nr:FtsW/RodA/SpoVE family cell cycle protein [Ignavibacteria bacterium]